MVKPIGVERRRAAIRGRRIAGIRGSVNCKVTPFRTWCRAVSPWPPVARQGRCRGCVTRLLARRTTGARLAKTTCPVSASIRTWGTELAKCIAELGRYQSTSARMLLHTSRRHPSGCCISFALLRAWRRAWAAHPCTSPVARAACSLAVRPALAAPTSDRYQGPSGFSGLRSPAVDAAASASATCCRLKSARPSS